MSSQTALFAQFSMSESLEAGLCTLASGHAPSQQPKIGPSKNSCQRPVYTIINGNPLMPTVTIWVQLLSIMCQNGLSSHLSFLTSGHSDAQG